MWYRVVVTVALLCFAGGAAACGRLGFGISDDSEDGPGPGPGPILAACRWDPTTAWSLSDPEVVTELDSAAREDDLALREDGLVVYFASDRDGTFDLFRAARPGLTAPFGTAELIDVSSVAQEFAGTMTPDELEIFWSTDRPGSADVDIWVAQRAAAGQPFSTPVVAANLNSAQGEFDPELHNSGLELYFSAGGPDAIGQDLFVATRTSLTQPFGPRTRLEVLSTSGDQADPTVTADRLTIAFLSNDGGLQLWYSTRPSVDVDFSAPTALPRSADLVGLKEPTVSADGCDLWLTGGFPEQVFHLRWIAPP